MISSRSQAALRVFARISGGVCVFFFSSRRRHTRLQGDWSSDVCSSDLAGRARGARARSRFGPVGVGPGRVRDPARREAARGVGRARRRDLSRRRHPGRHTQLRLRGRGVRVGHQPRRSRHRRADRLRRAHDRRPGPGPRPRRWDRGQQGRRGGRHCGRDGRPPPATREAGLSMLRLVLPKGSLEQATMQLFEDADLAVSRSSGVDYRASIDDPRVADVRILRPQEIPRYVADGLFDVGVTGRDWVEETGADVVTLTELHYSKATARPINVVLAVAADAPYRGVTDLPSGVRIHTEYPELTRRYFEKHGVEAEISLSYGATQAKVPEIADAAVEITETGRALRAAGLKVLDTILVSHTELIANAVAYENPQRRKAMEQIQTLLSGALEARGRVLVKLNVEEDRLDDVIALLPALRSPTVSKLAGSGAYAVETVVAKAEINTLIPALKDHGATGIIELPIAKIVH